MDLGRRSLRATTAPEAHRSPQRSRQLHQTVRLASASVPQVVSPRWFSRPGSPPVLVHRTTFRDSDEANRLRADRVVLKGRFLDGTIGYVLAKDLALYANAFCRPLPRLSHEQQIVLDTVAHQGPLTPRQIKVETGLLNKKIMPALHRLQEAFIVYEDQVDADWERGWYDFAAEWPEIEVDEPHRESASAAVCRCPAIMSA